MARAVPMGRQRQRVMKNSMESLAVRELLLYVPKGGGGWHGWRAGSRWDPKRRAGRCWLKKYICSWVVMERLEHDPWRAAAASPVMHVHGPEAPYEVPSVGCLPAIYPLPAYLPSSSSSSRSGQAVL